MRAGRPKTSAHPRAEQLRLAKRAQRARQRAANLVEIQLRLPKSVAAKLAAARRAPEFLTQLEAALDNLVVRVTEYPQLHDLAWNRVDELIPVREAFQLYERNWRFVDTKRMKPGERAFIARLVEKYGNGVLNV